MEMLKFKRQELETFPLRCQFGVAPSLDDFGRTDVSTLSGIIII
jgi:hypothetical protein